MYMKEMIVWGIKSIRKKRLFGVVKVEIRFPLFCS
jgi:hypothetical protein